MIRLIFDLSSPFIPALSVLRPILERGGEGVSWFHLQLSNGKSISSAILLLFITFIKLIGLIN